MKVCLVQCFEVVDRFMTPRTEACFGEWGGESLSDPRSPLGPVLPIEICMVESCVAEPCCRFAYPLTQWSSREATQGTWDSSSWSPSIAESLRCGVCFSFCPVLGGWRFSALWLRYYILVTDVNTKWDEADRDLGRVQCSRSIVDMWRWCIHPSIGFLFALQA